MIIIVSILGVMGMAALVGKFWKYIKDFLNGWLRDRLEGLFGQQRCEWYVNFIMWLDDNVCASKRSVQDWWKTFKSKILRIRTTYTKIDGGYRKATETVTEKPTDSTKAIRVITEEEVAWQYLPEEVRHEMMLQRSDVAELDVREAVNKKVEEKIAMCA